MKIYGMVLGAYYVSGKVTPEDMEKLRRHAKNCGYPDLMGIMHVRDYSDYLQKVHIREMQRSCRKGN